MKSQGKTLPSKPGVYLFRDQNKRVIYIGKAKNLKKRVASYFQKRDNLALDKKLMLPKIKKIDHIVVDNETEALLLEHNLIKKYHPRYNVVLKDDKSYIYIKISQEEFPRVFLDRKRKKENLTKIKIDKLFGPYTSADAARETLNTLRKIFPFRSCKNLPSKPCLFYHIKLCPAPCIQAIRKKDYQEIILEIIRFLKGQHQEIIRATKQKMLAASKEKDYERAAFFRNRLLALQKIIEKQKVISPKKTNQDILSLYQKGDLTAINLFLIREGRLLGKENFLLTHTQNKSEAEIIESFIKEHYLARKDKVPPLILPFPLSSPPLSLKISVPKRGIKKKLIQMGRENAQQFLQNILQMKKKEKVQNFAALEELASYLKLKKIPQRIEAYDISNIQGREATGSMIVFKNGKPDKSSYRRFKIRTIQGANDVAMMQEVLKRRFKPRRKNKWPQPDLVLVDGGKAQLNVTLKVLKEYELTLPVRALAKRLEEIYFPQKKNPMTLPSASQSLMLIKRIRDEAHRFALAYHRKIRSKKSLTSQLDQIPGIGPKKKKLLWEKFGSIAKIKKAKLGILEKLLGRKTARKLKKQLQ